MLARFTASDFFLLVTVISAFALVLQLIVRRLSRNRNLDASQLENRIKRLEERLRPLEQGHLGLRDDHDQLRQLVVNIGLSPAAPRTDWSTFDAQLQSLKRAVENLAGQPLEAPKDSRPTQWDRVSQDDDPGVG